MADLTNDLALHATPGGSAPFLCACLGQCPECGWVHPDGDGAAHPIDGVAICGQCRPVGVSTWAVPIGPYRDGRHPKDQQEQAGWEVYDSAVAAGIILQDTTGADRPPSAALSVETETVEGGRTYRVYLGGVQIMSYATHREPFPHSVPFDIQTVLRAAITATEIASGPPSESEHVQQACRELVNLLAERLYRPPPRFYIGTQADAENDARALVAVLLAYPEIVLAALDVTVPPLDTPTGQ